jgi:hypothetical protein
MHIYQQFSLKFRRLLEAHREIAAGLGVPHSTISGDLTEANILRSAPGRSTFGDVLKCCSTRFLCSNLSAPFGVDS